MAEQASTLSLAWRERVRLGSNQSHRIFIDFVVDDVSMYETVGKDFIGFLGGWLRNETAEERLLKQLLLDETSELESGRMQL
jgi:hypothetical protein